MSNIPDTPKTLLNELARDEMIDDFKWQQFDAMYRPVVTFFLVQRFGNLAHESDDIVQDIMIKLIEVLRNGRYDSSRSRFRTYLRTLVANTAIDRIRRLKRFAGLPLETLDWTGEHTSEAELVFLDRQWAEACFAAARKHVLVNASLSDEHRAIFIASENGEGDDRLAERYGLTHAAVRQIRHRINKAITAYARSLADE